ncbi:MAG: ectoine hydroxylase-related dioxygenase (phytanoyl-CoA dioxygenase family) [Paraglaciecola psychrophila]
MDENCELVVSALQEDRLLLQERFQHYGYLYFKQAAAAAKCEALLEDFYRQLSPYIVSDKQTGLPLCQGAGFAETDAIWDEVYPKMQSLEAFHSFFHQHDMLDVMGIVAGDEVFVYPMKMARISTPGMIGHETPPHQDGHSHNAGPRMAGVWVALHDIDQRTGRLKLLPGSHKNGIRPVHQTQGVGGISCEIYPQETCWHVSDVARGDVILFHSAMVHKAEPNRSEHSARMSIDTRFCDYGAPVFSTNLEPHHGWRIEGFDWDSIYRNWQRSTLQHYWRDYPNLF